MLRLSHGERGQHGDHAATITLHSDTVTGMRAPICLTLSKLRARKTECGAETRSGCEVGAGCWQGRETARPRESQPEWTSPTVEALTDRPRENSPAEKPG